MSGRKLRWLGFGLLATAGAGLLTLTSVMNASFAYGEGAPPGGPPFPNPDVTLAEVMGGTGTPIPQDGIGGQYMGDVFTRYLSPNFPSLTFASPCPAAPCDVNGLFTPETLYPLTGVKTAVLSSSVSEGVRILDLTIQPSITADTPVGVFGYSQSAAIASLEMEQLDPSGTPSTDPVDFVLIGNPMNPNGGFLERFPGLDLASIGLPFYGATPANDFPTVIYTGEYDGYADFPRYPIDFLSDLNAYLGIDYVHADYPVLTAAQLDSAFLLPGSEALGTPDSLTNYYMIPTTDLPLLDPLRSIPIVGNPLADLLQPDLTYLVNLGYGDPLYGWSTAPWNIPTPFGLFPSLSDLEMMPGLLVSGTEQGIRNFIGDFTGTGPDPVTLSLGSLLHPSSGTASALADPLTALSALASDPTLSLTDIVNTLSSSASTAYGTLLATADFANMLLTSIPAYEFTIFLDNLEAGNLLDAIGLPIAAETAAVTLVGAFELDVLEEAAMTIKDSLMGLIP